MKASELIADLQELMKHHGDLTCYIPSDEYAYDYEFDDVRYVKLSREEARSLGVKEIYVFGG